MKANGTKCHPISTYSTCTYISYYLVLILFLYLVMPICSNNDLPFLHQQNIVSYGQCSS